MENINDQTLITLNLYLITNILFIILFFFFQVYQGSCLYCEIKRNINPASFYYFRLQAISAVGASPYSDVFTVETPASSPAAVTDIKVVGFLLKQEYFASPLLPLDYLTNQCNC